MFPLKVLCIDGKLRPHSLPEEIGFLPEEGKIYTAERQMPGYDLAGKEHPSYFITELSREIRRNNFKNGLIGIVYILYECDRFVPISDVDETEYAEQVLNEIFVCKES